MLNELLLAVRFWMAQTPAVSLRASLTPASKLLSMLRDLAPWRTSE